MLVPLCRHFVVSMGVLVPKRKPASLAERGKKNMQFLWGDVCFGGICVINNLGTSIQIVQGFMFITRGI